MHQWVNEMPVMMLYCLQMMVVVVVVVVVAAADVAVVTTVDVAAVDNDKYSSDVGHSV